MSRTEYKTFLIISRIRLSREKRQNKNRYFNIQKNENQFNGNHGLVLE